MVAVVAVCILFLVAIFPVYFVPFLPYAVVPDNIYPPEVRFTLEPIKPDKVGPVTFPEPLWYPEGIVQDPPEPDIDPVHAPLLVIDPVYLVPFFPYAVDPESRLPAEARFTLVPTNDANVGPVTLPDPL